MKQRYDRGRVGGEGPNPLRLYSDSNDTPNSTHHSALPSRTFVKSIDRAGHDCEYLAGDRDWTLLEAPFHWSPPLL